MIKSLIVDNQFSELNENKLSTNNFNNFVSSFVKPNTDNCLNLNENSQISDNSLKQYIHLKTDINEFSNESKSSTSSNSLSSENSSLASIIVEILTKSNENLSKCVSNETMNGKDLNISLSSSSLDSSSFENIYSIYTFYQNTEINKKLLENYIEDLQIDNNFNKNDNSENSDNLQIGFHNKLEKEIHYDLEIQNYLEKEIHDNSEKEIHCKLEKKNNSVLNEKLVNNKILNDNALYKNSRIVSQNNITEHILENNFKNKSIPNECEIKFLKLNFKKQSLTSIVIVWPLKRKNNDELSMNKKFSIDLRPTIKNEYFNVHIKY